MVSTLPTVLPLQESAFFFDFDGTLVELASTPDGIDVTPAVKPLLQRLCALTGGAVAIVSGRSIATLDSFLAPLRLPMAGEHGAERRNAQGQLFRSDIDQTQLEQMTLTLSEIAQAHPGLLLEVKGAALSLHFRHAPQHEQIARRATEELVARDPEKYVVQPGKMVFEIKPKNVDKGKAIAAFLQELPFAGRTPFFFGDDLTDEKGFAVVNERGGWTVKVGGGATLARTRFDSVQALLAWLAQI